MGCDEIWTPERITLAQAELERWAGTPHRNRMAKPGVGIDCIHFVFKVANAAGIAPTFEMPYYNVRWGVGRAFNVLERVITKCFHVESIRDRCQWKPGDMVIFQVGEHSNHIGLLWHQHGLGVWHAQTGKGVIFSPLNDEIKKTVQVCLRFTGLGMKLDPATLHADEFKPWAQETGQAT